MISSLPCCVRGRSSSTNAPPNPSSPICSQTGQGSAGCPSSAAIPISSAGSAACMSRNRRWQTKPAWRESSMSAGFCAIWSQAAIRRAQTCSRLAIIRRTTTIFPNLSPRRTTRNCNGVFTKGRRCGRKGLLLLRATGMRIGECLQLTADSLRELGQNQWAIRVPLGKLHTERWVPVDDDTRRNFHAIQSLRPWQAPDLQRRRIAVTAKERHSAFLLVHETGTDHRRP